MHYSRCVCGIRGQVVQDLIRILVRKNVVIDMDLDATLAQLEPWSHIHRQIAMELPNRSGVDVGPGVKQL